MPVKLHKRLKNFPLLKWKFVGNRWQQQGPATTGCRGIRGSRHMQNRRRETRFDHTAQQMYCQLSFSPPEQNPHFWLGNIYNTKVMLPSGDPYPPRGIWIWHKTFQKAIHVPLDYINLTSPSWWFIDLPCSPPAKTKTNQANWCCDPPVGLAAFILRSGCVLQVNPQHSTPVFTPFHCPERKNCMCVSTFQKGKFAKNAFSERQPNSASYDPAISIHFAPTLEHAENWLTKGDSAPEHKEI